MVYQRHFDFKVIGEIFGAKAFMDAGFIIGRLNGLWCLHNIQFQSFCFQGPAPSLAEGVDPQI